LAIGDGALGFWNAISKVYPETRHQRCWVHKTAIEKQVHATEKKLCRQNIIVILQIHCTSKTQNVDDLKTAQHFGAT
jgi:transposase-like protein